MSEVYITRSHCGENAEVNMTCPVCGAKIFCSKDVVDGFYFGWSIGCPRYCNNDGIHGHDMNTPEEERLTIFYCDSKEDAIKKWRKRMLTLGYDSEGVSE